MSEETREKIRAVSFAAILSLVCGMLIITTVSTLKDMQDKNVINDRRVNILKSVGLLAEDVKYSFDDISRLYEENITSYHVGNGGRLLSGESDDGGRMQLYLYMKEDTVQSYILPIDTRGLWGKILGYLALKSDGLTIQGFTVYSHSETPGLGGEIESKWFRDNFVGKKIVDQADEFVSIGVAKGKAPEKGAENYVDGISGATLTGQFLTTGLKQILQNYEPVSLRFRSGNIGKKHQLDGNSVDGNSDNNEK